MKKVISLFLSLAMLLSIVSVVDFSAYADVETGRLGSNVTYSLDTSTGLLTISGTGAMYNYTMTMTSSGSNCSSPFYNNRQIKRVIIESGVTSVGNYAFCACMNLMSVAIPDSMINIGDSAFAAGISKVDYNGTVFQWKTRKIGSGNDKLKNAIIICTDDVIGNGNTVTIDNLKYKINNDYTASLVGYTDSPKNLVISKNISYESGKFKVTSIGNYAFDKCTSLTSVTIPDSVTSIGNGAFYNCTRLTSVTIPDSVTSIGGSVFYGCTNLEKVDYIGTVSQWKSISGYSNVSQIVKCSDNIITNENTVTINNLKYKINNDYTASLVGYTDSPENLEISKNISYESYTFKVTSIGSSAFYGCTSLTSVTIPDSVTSIGNSAFSGCTSLTSVNYSGTKSQWKAITVGSDNYYLTHAFIKCTDGIIGNGNTVTVDSVEYKLNDDYTARVISYSGTPENITISESVWYEGYTFKVTSIDSAFDGCTSLTSVTIPNSVTRINNKAFYNCTSLTSVKIPDSVTSIGCYAFENCTSLTSVTIPNSVTRISSSAFKGCTNLKSITIPNSVTSIGQDVFSNCSNLKSVNYNGTKAQWKSISGYSNVSQIIKCTDGIIGNGNTVTVDSVEYKLNDDYTARVISYLGTPENITISECVSYESYTFKVTSIGSSAFKNCTSLTSITIPNSVTEIGKDTFYNCTSLAKVDYNGTISQWKSISGYNNVSKIIKCTDGVIGNRNIVIIDNLEYQLYNDNTAYIFRYVNKTKTFKIPESVTYEGYSFNVTSISSQAFWGCTSLTSLTIPNSITSIDREAFYNCSNLKFVIYNGTKTQWNAISISNSDNSYLTGAIIKCTDGIIGNGNTVTIDNLKYQLNNDQTASLVGYTASPENLVIPENISYEGYTLNVTSIGEFAFSGCTSLTSITIPYSVTTIDNNAFNGCTSLTSIDYNGTVSQWKSIKGYGNVSKIIKCTDGIIGNGNTVTVDSVKYRLNDDYTAEVISYSGTPENITILESVAYEGVTFKVTSIGSSAFKDCTSLTSVTIPNSVESIGDNAFQNCTSLTSITIPDSVTSIGDNTFNGCSKLKKIEIPDSVTYIGSKAFDGTAFYNTVKNWEDGVLYCGNHLISAKSDVTKITVKASTVSIATGALDNCKSLEKINVLNPKCVINCTIPKTAVIGGAEGSTAEDFAQKNNMSIDYFEECTHSDKVQVVIAATCTEQGAVQSRCADCDKLISQTFTAPLGHTMVITTPAKAPTCTTNGNTQAGYCTVCGYNEVSTVIPATGHNFSNNAQVCLNGCGVANPNYVAPTQPTSNPTQSTIPTQPNQNDTNTSNDEDVTVTSKPKSASIKKVKGAKKAIELTWGKVASISGYEIQVATDKKFKKNKKTVTIKKQKTTKTTVKKLKAKKKYYVRIRTYKIVNGKKVYSAWSKVKSVKTK